MSDPRFQHLKSLTNSDRRVVQTWMTEFDKIWKNDAHLLEETVKRLPPPGNRMHQPILIELARIDLHKCWKAGRTTTVESYLKRFPDLAVDRRAPIGLVIAEVEARMRAGQDPQAGDYDRRFPEHAAVIRRFVAETSQVVNTPRPEPRRLPPNSPAAAAPALKPLDPELVPTAKVGEDVIKRAQKLSIGLGGHPPPPAPPPVAPVPPAYGERPYGDRNPASQKKPSSHGQTEAGSPPARKQPEVASQETLDHLPGNAGQSRTTPTAGAGSDELLEEFGKFRILGRLGGGGMGTVYKAKDTKLERIVALKVPKFISEDTDVLIARFKAEARAAANLRHPNICPIFETGDVNGTNYLAMAFIEGHTLADVIEERGGLPPRKAALIIRKLALAMQEAHDKQVLHRDLKPQNILIDKNGEPVIVDFGLAKELDRNTIQSIEGQMLGTPAYMAPEQVIGNRDHIGPRCDIYALGVILYQMLAGRLPFEGALGSILAQVVSESPKPPSLHRPDTDERLEAICLKAMARRREDRYPTMAAFADALTDYVGYSGETDLNLPEPPGRAPKSAADTPVHRGDTTHATRPPGGRKKGVSFVMLALWVVCLALIVCGVGVYLYAEQNHEFKARLLRLWDSVRGAVQRQPAGELDPPPTRPRKGFAEARKALDERRYQDAVAGFTAVLAADPADAEALAYRGMGYAGQRDFDSAARDAGKAAELDPASEPAAVLNAWVTGERHDYETAIAILDAAAKRGNCGPSVYVARSTLHVVWATVTGRLRSFDLAREDATRALTAGCDSAHALAVRGLAALGRDDVDAAQKDADAAVKTDPKQPLGYLCRARAAAARNQKANAWADLVAARKLWPGHPVVALAEADLRVTAGDYDRAVADYDAVIKTDPKNPYAYACRGLTLALAQNRLRSLADSATATRLAAPRGWPAIYRCRGDDALGEYDQAVAACDAALKADPGSAEAYYERGRIKHLRQRRPDAAVQDLTKAVDLDPGSGRGYFLRGQVRVRLREYDAALDDFGKALDRRVNPSLVALNRGLAYQGKGDAARALAQFNEAIAADPQHGPAYVARADLFAGRKEYQPALASYGEALGKDPALVDAYLGRAAVLLTLERLQDAMKDCDQAVRLAPKSATAHALRGGASALLDQYGQAETELKAAFQLDGTLPAAFFWRGVLNLQMTKYDPAVADLSESLRLSPGQPLAHFYRGLAHFRSGDNAKAQDDLNRTLALDPEYAPAYHARGDIAADRRQYADAIRQFDEALKRNPKLPVTLASRAECYRMLGDYDQAITDASASIALRPDVDLPWGTRGAAYNSKRAYAKAVEDFTRAVTLNPRYPFALAGRGLAYDLQNKPDLALRDLNLALEVNNKYTLAYLHRGWVFAKQSELTKALADFDALLGLNPKSDIGLARRGFVRHRLKRLDDALSDYDAALGLDPKYTWAYLQRSYVYSDKAMYRRAIDDCDRAIQLDPNDDRPYAARAANYAELGEPQKAIDDYTKAISLDAGWAQYYYQRGNLFLGRKEYTDALSDYTDAIRLRPKVAAYHRKRAEAREATGDAEGAADDRATADAIEPKKPDDPSPKPLKLRTVVRPSTESAESPAGRRPAGR